MNKVLKEHKAFLNYEKYVGIIQIPHHGSIHNFNLSFFEQFSPIVCPVSFGTKNKYGHPATSVINTLSVKGFRPVLINETPQSELIQKIEVSF